MAHLISWPTKRLLMAEVLNVHDDETGNSHDGRCSPGGETQATLDAALDSVQQGYEPYGNFPSAFVAEELKLLIQEHGPKYPAGELLTKRDWHHHDKDTVPIYLLCDPDLGQFLEDMAQGNGIDRDGYGNQLLENAVLDEVGRGEMILNRSQAIGGYHVDAGTKVHADPIAGKIDHRRVNAAVPNVGPVEGDVAAGDLLKIEDADQMTQVAVQRSRELLHGLDVVVEVLLSFTTDPSEAVPTRMARVTCGSPAVERQAKSLLKNAGLHVYPVKGQPTVLHVQV